MMKTTCQTRKLNRNLVGVAVAGAIGLGTTTGDADAAALTSLVITSGTFALGVFTPTPNIITHFSNANLIGAYQPATWDTSIAQTGPASGAVMAFDFNGGGTWANMYTAASTVNGSPVGPVPSGDVSGTTLSVDLSALIFNWQTNNYPQITFDPINHLPITHVTGTASGGASGTFTASWNTIFLGGNLNGQTGTYNVSGTYATIPVPAAAWLMGSGLAGLAGLARRRRKLHAST